MTATAKLLESYRDTDAVALYDIAAQMGMVLVAQYRASELGARSELEAQYWHARAALIARQRSQMPTDDRAAILACMAMWTELCDALGPVIARP